MLLTLERVFEGEIMKELVKPVLVPLPFRLEEADPTVELVKLGIYFPKDSLSRLPVIEAKGELSKEEEDKLE